jgi:hypothetical protein
MVVRAGISAAAVREVQPPYIPEQPWSAIVVMAGTSAAAVREVQSEYISPQPL